MPGFGEDSEDLEIPNDEEETDDVIDSGAPKSSLDDDTDVEEEDFDIEE